jgi:hypothetical protein
MSVLRNNLRRGLGGVILLLAVAFVAARVFIGAHDASAGLLAQHADENCAACFASGGAPDPAASASPDMTPAPVFLALEFQSPEARAASTLVLAPLSRGPPSAFIAAA